MPDCVLVSFEFNKSKAFADRIPCFTVSHDYWHDSDEPRCTTKSNLEISMNVLFLGKVYDTNTNSN